MTQIVATGAVPVRTVRMVETIADLTALDPRSVSDADKAGVMVARYRTGAASGEPRLALWERSSSTATNRCGVFTATEGRWVFPDATGDFIDIRACGAVANDAVDDAVAIQAAIDLVAERRGTAHVPIGEFTSASMIQQRSYTRIAGKGEGSMINFAHNGHGIGNLLEGRIYQADIHDLALNTYTGYAPSNAIHWLNVSHSELRNVVIHAWRGSGWKTGVFAWGDGPSSVGGAWLNRVIACRIYVRSGPDTYGIYADGSELQGGCGPNSWLLLNNYINGQNNLYPTGSSRGLFFGHCNGFQCHGNTFEGVFTNAVYVDETSRAYSITGNRFEIAGGNSTTERRNLTDLGEAGFVAGNMFEGTTVYNAITPDVTKSTVLEPSFAGINRLYGSLLVGSNAPFSARTYQPAMNDRLIVASDQADARVGVVHGVYGVQNTPRTYHYVDAALQGGVLGAFSSVASLPIFLQGGNEVLYGVLSIFGSSFGTTNRYASPGVSILGKLVVGPSLDQADAWSYEMADGAYVMSQNPTAGTLGYWAGTVDGVTNRRVGLWIDNDIGAAVLKTGYSTGGEFPLQVRTGDKTNLLINSDGTRLHHGSLGIHQIPGEDVDQRPPTGVMSNVWLFVTRPGGTGGKMHLTVQWEDGSTNILAVQP